MGLAGGRGSAAAQSGVAACHLAAFIDSCRGCGGAGCRVVFDGTGLGAACGAQAFSKLADVAWCALVAWRVVDPVVGRAGGGGHGDQRPDVDDSALAAGAAAADLGLADLPGYGV